MINWVLILVVYWNGNVMTAGNGVFDTMTECFFAREQLSFEVGGSEGYFPSNMQAICIANDPSASIPTFPL